MPKVRLKKRNLANQKQTRLIKLKAKNRRKNKAAKQARRAQRARA